MEEKEDADYSRQGLARARAGQGRVQWAGLGPVQPVLKGVNESGADWGRREGLGSQAWKALEHSQDSEPTLCFPLTGRLSQAGQQGLVEALLPGASRGRV